MKLKIKNKYILSAICLGFILSNVFLVSANQDKILMKECKYSFNDENFRSWSSQDNKGVFLSITNNNLNHKEEANYVYTSQQPPRNYKTYDYNIKQQIERGISKIPELKVINNQPNIVYIECQYRTESSFLMTLFSAACAECGNSPGLRLTHDFDLAGQVRIQDSYASKYIYKTSAEYQSPYSYYNQKQQVIPLDEIYEVNGIEKKGIDFLKQTLPKDSEITVKSKIDISKLASGILGISNSHADNGGVSLISNRPGSSLWTAYIYINSEKNIEDILLPDKKIVLFSRKRIIEGREDIKQNFGCQIGTSQCIDTKIGDEIKAVYTYYNPFNTQLTNIKITHVFAFDPSGTGIAELSIGEPKVIRFLNKKEFINLIFAPQGEINLEHSTKISGSVSNPTTTDDILYAHRISSNTAIERAEGLKVLDWKALGGDDKSYFYFGKLELEPALNSLRAPVIKIKVELPVLTNRDNSQSINENEFDIEVDIYKKTGNRRELEIQEFIPLNEESILYDNFPLKSKDKPATFSYELPIAIQAENNNQNEEFEYSVEMYSRKAMNNEPYAGKRIGTLTTKPTINPGKIFYADNTVFDLYYRYPSKINDLSLFNPDFSKKHNIILKIANIKSEKDKLDKFNIVIKDKDGNEILKERLSSELNNREIFNIVLSPLEVKELKIEIIRLQDKWPADEDKEVTFDISAAIDQEQEPKSIINFKVIVHKFVQCSEIEEIDASKRPNSCLRNTLTCYWNYVPTSSSIYETSPLGKIEDGECRECEELEGNGKYCSNYNNDLSCNEDPCNLVPEGYEKCEWNNDLYKCVAVKAPCKYSISNTCTSQQKQGILTFTPISQTADCKIITKQVPCAGYIELPFFSELQILLSIFLILLFYSIFCTKKQSIKKAYISSSKRRCAATA